MAFASLDGSGKPQAAPYAVPGPGSADGFGSHPMIPAPAGSPYAPHGGGSPPAGAGTIVSGSAVSPYAPHGDPSGGNPSSGGFNAPPGDQGTPTAGGNPNGPYSTDPGYQAAVAAEQMGLSQIDAASKAARERAIIDFGDPSMAAMAGFGLDPQAAAFARQNYLSGNSQLSRLDKQHDLMRQAVVNRLASHGILDSGDLGYGVGQADQNYGNEAYDARQKLLDYLNGVTSQDLSQRQQLHGGVISAIQQAYQNFLNHPELYPSYPGENTQGAAGSGNVGSVAAGRGSSRVAGPAAAGLGAAVHKVLTNPYTTGQKRFG